MRHSSHGLITCAAEVNLRAMNAVEITGGRNFNSPEQIYYVPRRGISKTQFNYELYNIIVKLCIQKIYNKKRVEKKKKKN